LSVLRTLAGKDARAPLAPCFAIDSRSRNDERVTGPSFLNLPNDGIEFGNQKGPSNSAESSARLVLASYNIRYAAGRYLIASGLGRKLGINFPRSRTEAINQNIKTAARVFTENTLLPPPHILALQEADKGTGRAGRQHVAARLADAMRQPYVHVSAGLPRGIPPKQREWWLNFEEQVALDDQGDMGVALVTRLALADVTRIDLPWHDCPWRPRLAMAATVNFASEQLRIFNVHIDPHGPLDNQHQQTETVIEQARQYNGPSVILGDFNTLSKQKAIEIRGLMERYGYKTPFPTDIPTWRGAGVVRFHADWIFVKGARASRWGVVKPLNVSDHWPVWAEIEP
jgi:endonuclease/exonuclease/phosphatase family metal-dependent hydrolase